MAVYYKYDFFFTKALCAFINRSYLNFFDMKRATILSTSHN